MIKVHAPRICLPRGGITAAHSSLPCRKGIAVYTVIAKLYAVGIKAGHHGQAKMAQKRQVGAGANSVNESVEQIAGKPLKGVMSTDVNKPSSTRAQGISQDLSAQYAPPQGKAADSDRHRQEPIHRLPALRVRSYYKFFLHKLDDLYKL